MMRMFYKKLSLAYFLIATLFLMLLAVLLLLTAIREVIDALAQGRVQGLLDSVGLVIIGFAIIETAKFIAEEEILREKELRSAVESRRSPTKFITIIVIAASLEALVMVFKTGRTEIPHTIYPAILFASSMIALVSLGLYQWLSSRIAPASESEREATESEPPS